MKDLSINRALDDVTRKQGIWIAVDGKIAIFSLHITDQGEIIITDNADYTKIYSIQSIEFFNMLERAQM